MDYDVQITEAPRRDIAVVRTRTTFDEVPAFMRSAFAQVAGALGPRGLLGDGPAIGRYSEIDPAAGTLEVATTEHIGAYPDVSKAYDAIASAMALHGREIDESTMWEEYWSPPGTPDDETRTVVFCPLKPTA